MELKSIIRGAALLSAVLLASCGGGGDGGAPPSGLVSSASVAQRCVAPRPAGTVDPYGQAYGDVQGTAADEKQWVRSWIDETYLWYQDVRALSAATLSAANYANALDYFDALKSPLITASNKPKDQFHFTYDTDEWNALSQSGASLGYGFEFVLVAAAPPREVRVIYTNAGTPAASANIARGARIVTIDGVDVANGADVATLNNGLFPSAPGNHSFGILDLGATTPRTVTLAAQTLSPSTVQNVKTLPAPNQNVGYMQFNDHLATSEAQLVSAINQLKTAGVTDLVLDIRYNGGGYLDVASELAYMIAGPGPTAGKTFEQLTFNDKNPFNLSLAERTTPFHSTAQGFSLPNGQALPTLNLSRVFVLTGAGTCSASEAIVNGLRGVGVTVNLIGATTCGKPYGFYPTDNCSTTYFAIQFQGVNQLGQGNYADGFTPTCAAADDYTHQLGDPAEGRLAVALAYRNTGICVPGMSVALGARSAQRDPAPVRSIVRENRIYRHH